MSLSLDRTVKFWWMCSVLTIFAVYIFLFIVISDYTHFCTGISGFVVELNQHDYANQKKSRQKSTCSGEIGLVLVQERIQDLLSSKTEHHQAQTTESPFERSQFRCQDLQHNECRYTAALEMFAMQADLQWKARALCKMRAVLEASHGSSFCSSISANDTKACTMVREPMAGSPPMGTNTMGQISQEKAISKTENAERPTTASQRKGQAKASRRSSAIWSAIIACHAYIGASLDGSHCFYAQPANWTASTTGTRFQGRQRQGQANALIGCSPSQTPGCPARRRTGSDEGRLDPLRPGRDEAAPCSSLTAWKSEERDCCSTSSASEHARCMEKLLVAISPTVDGLYKSIHDPGKATHGKAEAGTGQFGDCKGEPQLLATSGWRSPQGGCRDHQRYRRHCGKGTRIHCRSKNCCKLPGPGEQSTSLAYTSCASCAARSRSRPAPEKTESHVASQQRKGQRHVVPRFWRGRVNTPAACIAHLPLLHLGVLNDSHQQPSGLPNFAHVPGAHHATELDLNRSYSFPDRCIAGDPFFPSVTRFEVLESQPLHNGGQAATHAGYKSSSTVEQFETSLATLKWQHTVLTETDFTDEWTAQDRAFHLAAEFMLQVSTCARPLDPVPTAVSKPSIPKRVLKQVTFKEEVDLYIGLDEDQSCCCITIPLQSLNMPNKPWSIVPLTVGMHDVAQDVDPSACLGYCEVQNAFHQVSLVDPPCTKADAQRVEHTDFPVFEDVNNALDNEPCSLVDHFGVHAGDTQVELTNTSLGFQPMPSCISGCVDHSASQPWNLAGPTSQMSFLQPQTPQPFVRSYNGILPKDVFPFVEEPCNDERDLSDIEEVPSHLTAPCQSRSLRNSILSPELSKLFLRDMPEQRAKLKPQVKLDLSLADAPLEQSTCDNKYVFFTPPRPSIQGKAMASRGSEENDPGRDFSTSPNVDRPFVSSVSSLRRGVQKRTCSDHRSRPHGCGLFHQCRLEHESPIVDFAQRADGHQPPDGNGQNAQVPPQQIPPAFVADLSTRFVRMGYDINSGDFDVLLRTWYIDHATIRRWTAPRNLQLIGPPRGWEEQFSSIWVDQINPDEWFDVTIIHPDPPRAAANSFVVLDVVISQSLQLDRYAGLVTVVPNMQGWFSVFSVVFQWLPLLTRMLVVLTLHKQQTPQNFAGTKSAQSHLVGKKSLIPCGHNMTCHMVMGFRC